MISEIVFTDCWPFKDATVDFSPGLNVITGANGSGKSFLLESIHALLERTVNQNAISGIRRQLQSSSAITLRLTKPTGLEIVHPVPPGSPGLFGQRREVPLPEGLREVFLASLHALRPPPQCPSIVWISPTRGDSGQPAGNRDLATWRVPPTATRYASIRSLLDAIQDEPDDLDALLKQTLSSHFILDRKPLINLHKSRTRDNVLVADISSQGVQHELGGAADGPREILFIVAETFTARNGLVMIDEPELHLHPKAQDLLAAYLHHLTTPEGGSNQVILATHSLSFIYGCDSARVINLKKDGSASKPAIIVDAGKPTEAYDDALRELGYSLDTFGKALKFHETNNKPFPVRRHEEYAAWLRPD